MESLVEYGKYGSINTTDTSTNGFYVIMFTSVLYTLQENTTIDGNFLIAGELVVNAKYLCSMQVDRMVYHVRVLLVHQFWTKNGCPVYHQRNRNDINKLLSALIGQY